jgi:hypothetical protein
MLMHHADACRCCNVADWSGMNALQYFARLQLQHLDVLEDFKEP